MAAEAIRPVLVLLRRWSDAPFNAYVEEILQMEGYFCYRVEDVTDREIEDGVLGDVPVVLLTARHIPYHLVPPYSRGFDFYTHGRGPLWEGYEGYAPDDFPQTRKALSRMLQLPVLPDPEEGVVDQFLAAFRKIAKHYRSLIIRDRLVFK